MMRTLTPGAWYFLFLCKGCNTKQILFRDLNQGRSTFLATFTVQCQDCGHKGTYDSEQIERYHHPSSEKRSAHP
jgi:ribosomal protein S27E